MNAPRCPVCDDELTTRELECSVVIYCANCESRPRTQFGLDSPGRVYGDTVNDAIDRWFDYAREAGL